MEKRFLQRLDNFLIDSEKVEMNKAGIAIPKGWLFLHFSTEEAKNSAYSKKIRGNHTFSQRA